MKGRGEERTVYLSLHEEPNGEGGRVGLYKVGHGGHSSQQEQQVSGAPSPGQSPGNVLVQSRRSRSGI